MAGKPEWLKKLEREQAAKLISKRQEKDLAASHTKILKDGAPKLWNRIVKCLADAVHGCDLESLKPAIDLPTRDKPDSARIDIFGTDSATPLASVDIRFKPDKIEWSYAPAGRRAPGVLFFTLSGGKVCLRDEFGPLPDDDEKNDLAEIACQRLLEPLLRDSM